MRSHGVPDLPDPDSGGGFDKSKLRQLGVQRLPGAGGRETALQSPAAERRPAQGPTITPADRADYLRAAACMRSHGFPDFPDPTFQNNNVQTDIPSSINQDSPQFRSAATTCTKLIPAGLPYSSLAAVTVIAVSAGALRGLCGA